MTTRRDFIGFAVSTATFPLWASEMRAVVIDPPIQKLMTVNKVIIDSRYEESQQFGDSVKSNNLFVQDVNDEPTSLWYEEFKELSSRGGMTISGLTNHRTLICLEHFAREFNLITLHKGEHLNFGKETKHKIFGSNNILFQLKNDTNTKVLPWTTQLATAITKLPRNPATAQEYTTLTTPSTSNNSGTLFSWVLTSRSDPTT